jgi:hypothetical protein
MELRIPINTPEEVTERQAVLGALLHKLLVVYNKDTHFYFYSHDLRKISNTMYDSSLKAIKDIYGDIFEFGMLNGQTCRIKFKNKKQDKQKAGRPAWKPFTLESNDAIAMWFYLLGRIQDPSLIVDRQPTDELFGDQDGTYSSLRQYEYWSLK